MFPAMNTMMWQHPFTQEHVQKLNRLPFVYVVTPASGLLACGDEGAGKLMEVEAISDLVEILNPLEKLKHRVLITTGPTMAPMDPVRFITNPASGKTGLELAKAYLKAGAEVHLLTGSDSLSLTALAAHPLAHISFVPTTQLMHEKAAALAPTCDTVIAAAAVADFEFDYSAQKVKKEKLLTLQLKPAIDILADLLKRRRHEQKFISFAAETDTREEVFKEKFLRKPVDLMIGNSVDSGLLKGDAPKGFRADDGSYWFITAQSIIGPHSLSKTHLAEKVVRWDLQGEVI
jgi:phosphopantothenoylcysteine decarboxylase/phosphopantothenate--cysteine ligase